MKTIAEKTSNNFKELQEYLQSTESKFYYRGMASSEWRLMTSIDRRLKKLQKGNDNLLLSETTQNIFAEFKAHLNFLKNHSLTFNKLIGNSYDDDFKINEETFLKLPVILQHYGYPTRIQDWTTDWKIALYFCLEDEKESGDIALWLLRKESIPNIEKCLNDDEYLFSAELNPSNKISSFYNRLKPGIYLILESFFERIKAQKGITLTTGRADYMDFQDHVLISDSISNDDITKIIIRHTLRGEIKEFLRKNGINREALYPKDFKDDSVIGDVIQIEKFINEMYPNGKTL